MGKLKPQHPPNLREITVIFFIFLILFVNFWHVFPPLGRELVYIANRLIHYPSFSYEDKMKEKVGIEYYDWTELVREHTSVNSKVMHPPQMWPWGQSGNPEFSQYFLYPAKLVREDRKQIFDKGSKITHVLIAWGEGGVEDERLYGWPKFPVFAKKIYYLPQKRKMEIKGLNGLKEWVSDAQREINTKADNFFEITYTSSSFDYWIKSTSLGLLPKTKLSVEVKSNWPNSTAMIARVSYGMGKFAVFSSSPNQKTDEWEILTLSNLYERAIEFGKIQGWPVGQLKIEALGIDTGHPAKMSYLEKWGIIEVEKGGEKRLEFLRNQPVNTQTFLSLGNIYALEGDFEKAHQYYQKASLLEPSNPWAHFGLAEVLNQRREKNQAELEYEKAIELAPEISWFHFALGELYRKAGNLDQAVASYQQSLDLDPDSSWAHLSLGEIYEAQGSLDLAYQHYRLAGDPPRHAFLSDGKIAYEAAKRIEAKEKEVIIQSLEAIKKNPEDWEARLVLGNAYVILEDLDKAKEQYEVIYRNAPERYRFEELFKIPPIIVDQLNQPIYGIKGRAVETRLLATKVSVALDNYHSYVRYSKEFFPTENGTIEISWMPPDDLSKSKVSRNLLYQFEGFFVWTSGGRLNFAIFEKEEKKWKVISTSFLPVAEKWYQIGISYGKSGMYLFLNGKKIAHNPFFGGVNEKNGLFLARGPLWSVSDKITSMGFFETIKIYAYQKLIWE